MFRATLPELDRDKMWPVLVIALGLAIVLGALGPSGRGGHGPQSA